MKKIVLATLTTLALGLVVMHTRQASAITRSEQDLHDAAANNNTATMNDLISKGVNINAQDSQGSTALHRAAQKGNEGAVNLLLSNNANAFLENKAGKTPGEVADDNGHKSLATTLRDARRP